MDVFRAGRSRSHCKIYCCLWRDLGVNVGLNSSVLALLGYDQIDTILAFLVATAASATLNFLGMKFLVFKA